MVLYHQSGETKHDRETQYDKQLCTQGYKLSMWHSELSQKEGANVIL
ncbi:hypothetical protein JCM19233_5235 [Vibrio astriarenae]|nr:hypothetical protein JCM19233_5235 [Vibrio sp. C7]